MDSIKEFRASTGLSQSKFADYFGISVRTLQGWEQGKEPPTYLLGMMKRLWDSEKVIEKEYEKGEK